MSVPLALLFFLLGAATMFVGRDVLDVIRKTGRRGDVDLTAAAARGELLHLDWGDARVTSNVPVRVTAGTGSEALAEQPTGRRLRSVE